MFSTAASRCEGGDETSDKANLALPKRRTRQATRAGSVFVANVPLAQSGNEDDPFLLGALRDEGCAQWPRRLVGKDYHVATWWGSVGEHLR
jgi:hypothetical protein